MDFDALKGLNCVCARNTYNKLWNERNLKSYNLICLEDNNILTMRLCESFICARTRKCHASENSEIIAGAQPLSQNCKLRSIIEHRLALFSAYHAAYFILKCK